MCVCVCGLFGCVVVRAFMYPCMREKVVCGRGPSEARRQERQECGNQGMNEKGWVRGRLVWHSLTHARTHVHTRTQAQDITVEEFTEVTK